MVSVSRAIAKACKVIVFIDYGVVACIGELSVIAS
jgi:hypothetical protein